MQFPSALVVELWPATSRSRTSWTASSAVTVSTPIGLPDDAADQVYLGVEWALYSFLHQALAVRIDLGHTLTAPDRFRIVPSSLLGVEQFVGDLLQVCPIGVRGARARHRAFARGGDR